MKNLFVLALCFAMSHAAHAGAGARRMAFSHYVTTDNARWVQSAELRCRQATFDVRSKVDGEAPTIAVQSTDHIVTFGRWGTTFNEQDWHALSLLSPHKREEILQRAFAPTGELRLSMGRISMNANDYAMQWYACSEVAGDFANTHFNIERDKQFILPYIHAAQRHCPDMTFWMSPWSPPAWMKINHHYAVQSSKYNNLDPRCDALLFGDEDRSADEQVVPDQRCFPRRMAVQDFLIQDARHLQCYAEQFCRFIDLYAEQGVAIGMVMYQNEAYSYTSYPGCAWTADGIVRFNVQHLAPTLRQRHPEVELYLGTLNTNRYDHIATLMADSSLTACITGVGLQWEGGQVLERMRHDYPSLRYVQTESECGNGAMDWRAAEHTFHLINHYVGGGCADYCNWNLVLCDKGESAWGWKQNALVRVDATTREAEYTAEWYAYRHYSQFIQEGTKIIGCCPTGANRMPVLVALTPQNKLVIVAGNLSDEVQPLNISFEKNSLVTILQPHSLHTFVQK